MKTTIAVVCTVIFHLTALAQMDLPPEGFNPRATVSEEVGITNMTIKYSRPGVKGREGQIWGGLVANGFSSFNFVTNRMSSPWRAGANEATIISFEHDVKVAGKPLPAGSYALFMALAGDSATLIFSHQTDAWGSFYYNPEQDALRVNVKTIALKQSVEWLKYEFIEHYENSCVIALNWEKLSVPFKVDVEVEQIVLDRIRAEFTGVKGFISANKLQASRYCLNKNIHLEEALSWAQSAVTGKPFGQSGFDAYTNLATGYEKLDRLAQADSVMQEGLAIANVNQFTGYGRKLLSKKRHTQALEVMLAAQKKFGAGYPVNNGLSYAYSAMGNYAKALEFAQHALAQAPPSSVPKIKENITKLQAGIDINL